MQIVQDYTGTLQCGNVDKYMMLVAWAWLDVFWVIGIMFLFRVDWYKNRNIAKSVGIGYTGNARKEYCCFVDVNEMCCIV